MSLPSRESVTVQSYSPVELVNNPGLLDGLALSYAYVFNYEARGFTDDAHKVEDVKSRILSQIGGAKDDNIHSHLVLATVPYDSEIHGEDKGYLQVMINEVPHAIVGFLWSMGNRNIDEVKGSVIQTATMFKSQPEAESIAGNVDEAFKKLEAVDFSKLIYIPEFGVRQDYRHGFTAVRIMAKFAKELMHGHEPAKNVYLFWTDILSEMYGLAKDFLHTEDFFKLQDGRILMKGDCHTTDEVLSKW